VATEPSTAAVPDVKGLPVNDAFDALSTAGFTPNQKTKTVDNPDQDGIVVSQSPSSGSLKKKGSKVTVTVGRFDDSKLNPEGSATPTPTPTPTPSATP